MVDATQNRFDFEALESRCFLSAAPMTLALAAPMSAGAVMQPLAATARPLAVGLAKIAGKYTGTVVVTGVHSRPVNVTLKQAASGKLTGTLTTPMDSSIKVKVTGKVTSKKAFTFTLSNGIHSGGPIAGTGTGTIKGTKLSVKMTFVQGTTKTPGTLTLTKI